MRCGAASPGPEAGCAGPGSLRPARRTADGTRCRRRARPWAAASCAVERRLLAMSPRIVIVGGGSYHWAPRLLCDFANTPSLADAQVVLHDLDADRLRLMEDLGREIASRRGIALTTTAELDRKRALAGADFVITCFSVGGFGSMQH